MAVTRVLLALVALAQLACAQQQSQPANALLPRALLGQGASGTLLFQAPQPSGCYCLPGRPPADGCPCTPGCVCPPPSPDEGRYRRTTVAASITVPILVLIFGCVMVYVFWYQRRQRQALYGGQMMYGGAPAWAQYQGGVGMQGGMQGGMQLSPMMGGYPGGAQSYAQPMQTPAPPAQQDLSHLHGMQSNIQSLEMQNAVLRAEAAESRRVAEAAAAAAASAQASVDELARQRMRKGSVMEDLAAIQAANRPPR